MNDSDLVARSLAGDGLAREELVRRHAPRVRALCWSRLPRAAPLDDLVQESLLRALRWMPRLVRPESFGSFAAGIALRVCSDWRRAASRREISLDAVSPDGDIEVVDPEIESPAESEALSRAVRALPEIYRDVIALFYFADRSYREIANTLGISEAAVNARLAKARSLLRDALPEDRP